ncbi:multidrug and toxin extrusion protein 2-like [Hyperolius riggenbachi]|uniref:multidrug and toxin extrusion protein 2-like n=1 Tax=Hyperolius riggenbachi TaxID=752182 RepID=UPI0035A335F4
MTRQKEGATENSPLSGKPGGFRTFFHQLIPDGFCYEAKKLLQMSIPVFLSQLLVYLVVVVSSIFCGHLGKVELDSVTLASSIINMTGITIGYGMSSACDTLMSQTYGSKNKKRVGSILQRGILILLLCCFPCWALFINTEKVLLLCRQNPGVARLTQKYVMIFVPGLPAVFLQQLQSKYLQNQGIMWPQVITGVAVNIINAVINAIVMYVFKLGVEGSAWANIVSQWTMATLLFIYIIVKRLHVETWGGWSRDCLQEWDTFIYLSIPNLLMFCIEWWSFEIGGFLAGFISLVELGGQAIAMEVTMLAVMLPSSFGTAASVRIGNALGARDVEEAKKSCKVVLCCTVLGSLIISGTLFGLKNVIGYLFTNERDIAILVSQIMLLYAPFYLCDGTNVTCGGIMRGTGRVKIGATANVLGYYCIGLPVGITLMFVVKLGVKGLWIGLLCPVFLQTCIYIPYILRISWSQACEEASGRTGATFADQKSSHAEISESEVFKEESGDTMNSYSSIEGAVILPDIASGENDTKKLDLKVCLPVEATNVVGEILSTKQLIIRRGCASDDINCYKILTVFLREETTCQTSILRRIRVDYLTRAIRKSSIQRESEAILSLSLQKDFLLDPLFWVK